MPVSATSKPQAHAVGRASHAQRDAARLRVLDGVLEQPADGLEQQARVADELGRQALGHEDAQVEVLDAAALARAVLGLLDQEPQVEAHRLAQHAAAPLGLLLQRNRGRRPALHGLTGLRVRRDGARQRRGLGRRRLARLVRRRRRPAPGRVLGHAPLLQGLGHATHLARGAGHPHGLHPLTGPQPARLQGQVLERGAVPPEEHVDELDQTEQGREGGECPEDQLQGEPEERRVGALGHLGDPDGLAPGVADGRESAHAVRALQRGRALRVEERVTHGGNVVDRLTPLRVVAAAQDDLERPGVHLVGAVRDRALEGVADAQRPDRSGQLVRLCGPVQVVAHRDERFGRLVPGHDGLLGIRVHQLVELIPVDPDRHAARDRLDAPGGDRLVLVVLAHDAVGDPQRREHAEHGSQAQEPPRAEALQVGPGQALDQLVPHLRTSPAAPLRIPGLALERGVFRQRQSSWRPRGPGKQGRPGNSVLTEWEGRAVWTSFRGRPGAKLPAMEEKRLTDFADCAG